MLTHTENVKKIEALFMEVLGSYELAQAQLLSKSSKSPEDFIRGQDHLTDSVLFYTAKIQELLASL
jgi:hypothetical protein